MKSLLNLYKIYNLYNKFTEVSKEDEIFFETFCSAFVI